MQLIIDGRFEADRWIDWSALESLADVDLLASPDLDIIVSERQAAALDRAALNDVWRGRLGLRASCDARPERIAELLDAFALVAVTFPSMMDGRGFSLARRIRARGYRGELRASGPIVVDQYAFALACGFDSVEIPRELARRQPAKQWLDALAEPAGGHRAGYRGYQTGYRGASVLEARHRAQ